MTAISQRADALPTGTVTFMFTDIEGSTRLLQQCGPAWPGLLSRHNEIVRQALRDSGGIEVGTEGDSFFGVFTGVAAALAAAVAVQRGLAAEPWPNGNAIRVRIGLHTGEAVISDETYVGLEVHRTARIMGAGHGGQILVSATTRSLLDEGTGDLELVDLGAHRLKDLAAPEHIFQVAADRLQRDFPPLRTLDVAPNNLPTQPTSFIGREEEVEQVRELVLGHRLVTLTGPGGTGKTRLSLQVAAELVEHFSGGAYFVALAAIREVELVLPTIGQVLGLPDPGRRPLERIAEHVAGRRLLLVIDNLEQVVEAGGDLGELSRRAPDLSLLITSRIALRLYGEQEYPVPPLPLPDPGEPPSEETLARSPAVALFIERARAVLPDFELNADNAAAVAEICWFLDGLPLAIELAAARIRILTPQAMVGRLGRRLDIGEGGARDLPQRQRTLRGAIAWSYDMLDEADRALFACLSVFMGGAGIDEVERVCGDRTGAGVLDGLASLVDKSLIRQREGTGAEPRFGMLETIREFAVEQAVERGEWDGLRRAHASLFLEIAEHAGSRVMTSETRLWLDRLEQDHDNFRAAIAWAIEIGVAESALRLGAALWRFWQMRGYLAEGLDRLEQALAMPNAVEHPEARAAALSAAAGIAYWKGDNDRARDLYDLEIAQRRALGDDAGLAEALYGQSFTFSITGLLDSADERDAVAFLDEALVIFRRIDDRGGIARCLWGLANVRWGRGRLAEAIALATEAHELFRELDDQYHLGWSAYTIGLSNTGDTRTPDAAENLSEARRWFRKALEIFGNAGDVSGYTLVLDAIADIALREGDPERAARLSGAVDRFERASGTGLNFANRQVMGFDPQRLRDDPSLAQAWAEGAAMSAEEAVAYGLA